MCDGSKSNLTNAFRLSSLTRKIAFAKKGHGEATEHQDQANEAGPQNCTGEGHTKTLYPRCHKAAQREKGNGQA